MKIKKLSKGMLCASIALLETPLFIAVTPALICQIICEDIKKPADKPKVYNEPIGCLVGIGISPVLLAVIMTVEAGKVGYQHGINAVFFKQLMILLSRKKEKSIKRNFSFFKDYQHAFLEKQAVTVRTRTFISSTSIMSKRGELPPLPAEIIVKIAAYAHLPQINFPMEAFLARHSEMNPDKARKLITKHHKAIMKETDLQDYDNPFESKRLMWKTI